MNWPNHEASMTLTHNDHKNSYQTVEEWLADQRMGEQWFSWVSPEEQTKALATNSVWTLQWYPDTPVGFYALAASTFEALMEAMP